MQLLASCWWLLLLLLLLLGHGFMPAFEGMKTLASTKEKEEKREEEERKTCSVLKSKVDKVDSEKLKEKERSV